MWNLISTMVSLVLLQIYLNDIDGEIHIFNPSTIFGQIWLVSSPNSAAVCSVCVFPEILGSGIQDFNLVEC